VGFLSRYSGTDIEDLGDGYTVHLLRHLPGDAQEKAEAAKVRAIAQVQTDEGTTQRSVAVETTTDTAAYTTLLLHAAITAWNLTDERDEPLPLAPEEARLDSIRRLPAEVRALLRDRIEANIGKAKRSTAEQADFRGGTEGGAEDREGRTADPAGVPTPHRVLDPLRRP
jgi:hypothetical protein